MTYMVQTDDFFEAISVRHDDVGIQCATRVTDTQYIVGTNVGTFFCESFKHDGDTYMKVTEIDK